MQYFKIRKDGFKEIRKQMLVKLVPLTLIVLAAGITISVVNSKEKIEEVNVLPVIIPFIVLAVGFGLIRGVNHQKALFESYELTLTDNLITREQMNIPTIAIYFNDIREIVKNKNGSFTVKGKDPTDVIGIPAQVDNYVTLEKVLATISPIVFKPRKPLLEKYILVVVILVLGLMVCVYTVTNKIIVGFSGTVLVAILSWSFYEMRRSKNIDTRTKRSMWWVLVVLFSIIAVVVVKLFGMPVS